jgi:hypothetical protein
MLYQEKARVATRSLQQPLLFSSSSSDFWFAFSDSNIFPFRVMSGVGRTLLDGLKNTVADLRTIDANSNDAREKRIQS